MISSGTIKKMRAENGEVVHYYLPVGTDEIALNEFLGKKIEMTWLQEIHCIKCGRKTKTSFAQGYCYPCFISAPETEDCVLRPELCRAHEGIARDLVYAQHHCLINHIVYLADSGGIKVGVTRQTQLITRWIDQGASSVIRLAETPNRFLAGQIEVAIKKHLPDKTNWRNMLSQKEYEKPILTDVKNEAKNWLTVEYKSFISSDDTIVQLQYPVISYPEKVTSTGFEKSSVISGVLYGIRGQYLIFENGIVLNVRKYGGYVIQFEYKIKKDL